MKVWIVYNAERLIVGVFGTAASATALVDAGTGLTATAGLTTDSALASQPGQFYLLDGTVTYDKPRTDLEILKTRVWQVHAHLLNLWGQIQIEAAAHPWSELQKVHDYLARIHPSLYTLMRLTSRTQAQRTTYCDKMLEGPQLSNQVLEIPELFYTIAAADDVGTGQGVTYVNPITVEHVTIAVSLVTGTRFAWGLGSTSDHMVVTEQQLASGEWINSISS